MAIQSFTLDPNAQSYTDDEIVGKVNAATAQVSADKLDNGTTNKVYTDTEKSKLAGIDEGAEVNPTDDEVIAAINAATDPITRESALSQDNLKIVKTNPAGGEFLVKNIQRDADGKLDIEYEDTAQ